MSQEHQWNRVLVPVDFSEASRNGLQVARNLAARLGASIDLLHVIPVPDEDGADLSASSHYNDVVLPNAKKMLQDFWDQAFLETGTGEDIRHVLDIMVSDGTAVCIVARADSMRADLIVMGTHGRSSIAMMIFGSVANEVVRYAPCGVITVREPVIERDSVD